MTDPHCRIGRVRLKPFLVEGVQSLDPWNDRGLVENMIDAVRSSDVKGYSIIVTHADGSITNTTKGRPRQDFHLVGALTYELVRACARIKDGQP